MRKLVFVSEIEEQSYKQYCIEKKRETSRLWQKNNKERARIIQKKFCDNNREALNKRAIIYREQNREIYLTKRRVNNKKRRLEDSNYKFIENLRAMINMSFKRGKTKYSKLTKTENILGCKLDFFVNYILSKCPEGVTLSDFHRYGYHIDHIIPISLGKSEEEIIKLCHYNNLQPLWFTENLSKSNKILI